jgi:hypothetical protein
MTKKCIFAVVLPRPFIFCKYSDRALVLSGRTLVAFDTRLKGPTLLSARTHPSALLKIKKISITFLSKSLLRPHPFLRPLLNRRRARTARGVLHLDRTTGGRNEATCYIALERRRLPSYLPTATHHSLLSFLS